DCMVTEPFSELAPWFGSARQTCSLEQAGGGSSDVLGQGTDAPSPPLFPAQTLLLETLVYRLVVLSRQSDLLILFPKFFLDESQGIVAGRQTFDLVLAIFIGDGVERALHHVDVHLHPGVLITLDGQHDLFASEGLFQWSRFGRLGFIPLAIGRWCGMDVVRSGIVVLDLDVLPRHHAQYVRMILAAALVKNDRILGHVKGAAAQTVLHVNENIGEFAAVDHNGLHGIVALACCILAHINLPWFRSGTGEGYRAADLRSRGRIDWSGGRSGRSLRGR